MQAKFVNEKFAEKSDPIRDMGIGMPGFTPMFRLKKQYPGMNLPVGTIFGNDESWSKYSCVYYNEDGEQCGSTAWTFDYFEPWIGEFFEKL